MPSTMITAVLLGLVLLGFAHQAGIDLTPTEGIVEELQGIRENVAPIVSPGVAWAVTRVVRCHWGSMLHGVWIFHRFARTFGSACETSVDQVGGFSRELWTTERVAYGIAKCSQQLCPVVAVHPGELYCRWETCFHTSWFKNHGALKQHYRRQHGCAGDDRVVKSYSNEEIGAAQGRLSPHISLTRSSH